MNSQLPFSKSSLSRIVCIILACIFCLNHVQSHGESNAYHRLQGVELCFDDRSVSVAVNLGESELDVEEIEGRLEPTLKTYLTTTLSNSLVKYTDLTDFTSPKNTKASLCPEGTLLQSMFDIRSSGYAGDPTLILSSLTHVGLDVTTQAASTEETSIYYSFEDSLEFLEDYATADSFTIDINKAMALELVQNWWEDNPEAQAVKAPKPLPQIIGVVLSLLILIVGIYIIKR